MAAIISAPCKDCPKHQPGCHGKCKDYAEFLEKDAAIKDQIAQQRKKACAYGIFYKTSATAHSRRKEVREMNSLSRVLILLAVVFCLFGGCVFCSVAKRCSTSTERIRYALVGGCAIMVGAILMVLTVTH